MLRRSALWARRFGTMVSSDRTECEFLGIRRSWVRSFFYVVFHYRAVRSGFDWDE